MSRQGTAMIGRCSPVRRGDKPAECGIAPPVEALKRRGVHVKSTATR